MVRTLAKPNWANQRKSEYNPAKMKNATTSTPTTAAVMASGARLRLGVELADDADVTCGLCQFSGFTVKSTGVRALEAVS
ncbi:hypothetical protein GCM10008097_20270 [Mycetocola manganoxydans]|nr:hypothetical protein GCM10008097_20270 [Mycetocola manganoxydans]